MKKLMLVVAMLAMVLAVSAPAFAQARAVDRGDDLEFNAGAQNIIGSVGGITQDQVGEAEATADNDSTAEATVDQAQDVSISQTNELGNGLFLHHFHHWVFFF